MPDSSDVPARGRGAIVTGAASGVGLATARRLAVLGMCVCIAHLDGEALDKAARAPRTCSPLRPMFP
jgi:NAD(P)-dependent dehydrogenase (short-subunit alcohol dehydrogenase family)